MGCDASPFYSVMTGSEGIVTQNGKIVGEPNKPGLHFKIPFIQRIHMVELFRVRFLNLPVKNIDSLEAKLMWTVQNSKDFFIASQKRNIADIFKSSVTPKFNEVLSKYDLKIISFFREMQQKDPEFTNDDYDRMLASIQESVADYGMRIFRIHFQ